MEKAKRLSMFTRQYQNIASDELDESNGESKLDTRIYAVYGLVIAVLAFLVGLFVGRVPRTSWSSSELDGFPGQIGSTKTVWQTNHTFAMKPSLESEAAWQSIIPEGRGFVNHPVLAPENASLSVFHEIHCLHTLRVAYYISLHDNAVLKNSSYTDPYLEKIKARTAVSHVQHCFDYIRQSLMCAADTNFEKPEPGSGATDGWGVERQCRDYWGVVEWAERWRNNEESTILSAEGQDGDKSRHEHEG